MMPYTNNPQQNFELLLLVMLLLNLLIFFGITFSPSLCRNMANWASRVVDRIWHYMPGMH